MFTKPSCEKCNLNNDCYCQNKSQKFVNDCGMDKVLEYNRKLNSKHSQTYDNPDYAEFMQEGMKGQKHARTRWKNENINRRRNKN